MGVVDTLKSLDLSASSIYSVPSSPQNSVDGFRKQAGLNLPKLRSFLQSQDSLVYQMDRPVAKKAPSYTMRSRGKNFGERVFSFDYTVLARDTPAPGAFTPTQGTIIDKLQAPHKSSVIVVDEK